MNQWKLFATASSFALALAQTPSWAEPSITLVPNHGPSGTMVQIHACELPGYVDLGSFGGPNPQPLGTTANVLYYDQGIPPNYQGRQYLPLDPDLYTLLAENIPLVPCGNLGLGFGASTGRPPVSVPISGSPGPVVVQLWRLTQSNLFLLTVHPTATFTITEGVPPTVVTPPPVEKPLPDLIVERLGVPGKTRMVPNSRCPTTCPPFIDVFLRVTVKNQGVGPAGMFEIGGFYRDPKVTNEWTQGPFVTNNGANQTSLRTTTNLNPGESIIMEGWLRLPPSMRGKKPAAFMAKADICVGKSHTKSCAVPESNETNNESGERKFNLP